MQQIQKLKRIDQPGILAGYEWPEGLADFRRQNIIYGWNGTGKTSISRLFAEFGSDAESMLDLEVDLVVDNRQISGSEYRDLRPAVFVFNREYVEQNIKASQQGTMPPVYTLGRAKIHERERLAEIDALLPRVNERLRKARTQLESSTRRYERHLIDHASAIKRQLHSAGDNRFNNYNRGHYEQLSKQMSSDPSIRPVPLSEAEIEALLSKLQQSPMDALAEPSLPAPDFAQLLESVSSLAATSASAIKLEQLQDDPDLSAWLRDGLRIHRDRGDGTCFFCEQSLPSQRLEKLGAHFSRAFEQLQDSIQSKELEVEEQRRRLSEAHFAANAELYPDLQQSYAACLLKVHSVLDQALSFFDQLLISLEQKKARAFEVLQLDCKPPTSWDSELAAVAKVVDEHNVRCLDYAKQIEAARTQIEQDYVAQKISDYEQLVEEVQSANEDVTMLADEVDSLRTEAEAIRHTLKEHHTFADTLNQELEKYLGHSELKLSALDDGYAIQRSGVAAERLSEGETTAITLLYFLASVASHESGAQDCIVMLDDPVTSLDSSALHFASQYIRQTVIDCAQVFILTHNFAFFRQLKSWIGRSAGPGGERDMSSVGFYMLKCRSIDGVRRSSLVEMDPLLYKYDTEYHFLFAEVYRASNSPEHTSLSELYLLPNAARRLLEMFFAFKRPKLRRQLGNAIDQSALEPGRKARLARFLHSQSHNPFVGGDDYEFVALGETPAAANDVLDLIKETDAEHYANMEELVQETSI